MFPRTAAFLPLVVACLTSAAHAQIGPVGPAPAPAPNCPRPTLAICQGDGYLTSLCGGIHRTTCKTLIEAQIPVELQKLTPLPGVTSFVGNRPVRLEPHSFGDFTVSGMDTLVANTQAKNQLGSVRPGDAFLTLVKGMWHANANLVESCLEYAHEKYWDYSVFEDTVAPRFDDLRDLYAAADRTFSVPRPANNPIASKDRRTPFSITFPTNGPKNSYYKPLDRWYPPSTPQSRFTFSPNVLAWIDPRGQSFHPNQGWLWHRQQSAALANVPDDVLDKMYAKQQAYEALLQRRARAVLRNSEVIFPWMIEGHPAGSTPPTWVRDANEATAKELKAIDAEINTALANAKVDGCLEIGPTTKCDWSPHLFADMLQQGMLAQKQDAFRKCTKYTGSDFTAGSQIKNARPIVITPGGCTNCATSSTDVDTFLREYQSRVTEVMMKDPRTGRPILGSRSADTGRVGNSRFNVNYSYTGGWEITDLVGKSDCEANLRSYSTFNAGVKILDKQVNVLTANLALGSRSSTLHADGTVRVSSSDILVPAINKDGPTQASPTFNVVEGPKWSAEASGASVVVIVAIPVKVAAGLAGSTGVEVAFKGKVQRTCPTAALQEVTKVTPWAKLDAFASASVDVVVAEVGIRGELTLLKISLPLASTLELKPMGSPSKMGFTSDSQMDIELRTLDGRIVLFADVVGADEARKTLVKWRGPLSRSTLFDWNQLSIPLDVARAP